MSSEQPEELVPRRQVAREFGVTTRTVCRWEHSQLPGFDGRVCINRRNYHPRTLIESAKKLGFARVRK
jgi:hypothetical protein